MDMGRVNLDIDVFWHDSSPIQTSSYGMEWSKYQFKTCLIVNLYLKALSIGHVQ